MTGLAITIHQLLFEESQLLMMSQVRASFTSEENHQVKLEMHVTSNDFLCYTGCIKKKVIELQRAIIRESLGV